MKLHQRIMVWLIVILISWTACWLAWGLLAFWYRGNPGSLAFCVGMGILILGSGLFSGEAKDED